MLGKHLARSAPCFSVHSPASTTVENEGLECLGSSLDDYSMFLVGDLYGAAWALNCGISSHGSSDVLELGLNGNTECSL